MAVEALQDRRLEECMSWMSYVEYRSALVDHSRERDRPGPEEENYAGDSTWMRAPWTVPLVDARTCVWLSSALAMVRPAS
jgi:hypothetical protein